MMYHDELRLRRSIIVGGVLFAVFITSVLLYVFRPSPSVQRILYFPDETSHILRGELRELPKLESRESEVEYLIREIILGPTMLRYGRLLPRDTVIESLLLRDGVLFVGFSEHVILAENMILGPVDMLAGLRKTVKYNYPRIDRIRVFIDGIEFTFDESPSLES